MVGHLGWEPLATRRRNMRLCMMYKIAHTVVGDPWTEWLTTSKRVTRGFHAWKYIPIYSHHNIYKFSDMPPGTDCPYPIRILAFFEMIRPYHVVIRIWGKLLKNNLWICVAKQNSFIVDTTSFFL